MTECEQSSTLISDGAIVMKIVRVMLDDDLLSKVDQAARKLRISRSGFPRVALREALNRMVTSQREAQHQRRYAAKPEELCEFNVWADEQVWPE